MAPLMLLDTQVSWRRDLGPQAARPPQSVVEVATVPAVTPKASYRMMLLVEAEGLAPSVRSAGFQRSWSRLYQAGPFTVDMMFEPGRRGARVFGQILHQDDALTAGSVMLGDDGGVVACAEVGPDGDFTFEVTSAGLYRMHLLVADTELTLEALDCS